MGQAGGCDQSRKTRTHAVTLQAPGDMLRNPGPGFAGVHADYHFGVEMMSAHPARQRRAHRKRSGLVKRILPSHTAHPVGSK
jgi:hypothetical protein